MVLVLYDVDQLRLHVVNNRCLQEQQQTFSNEPCNWSTCDAAYSIWKVSLDMLAAVCRLDLRTIYFCVEILTVIV